MKPATVSPSNSDRTLTFRTFKQRAKIVNRMLCVKSRFPLNLAALTLRLPPPVDYHVARPCRIRWRFQNSFTVQLFPNGTIQLMGSMDNLTVQAIISYLSDVIGLSLISHQPTVSSITVYYQHPQHITPSLTTLPSNNNILNEREIFPGTLIQHHQAKRRFHTSAFVSGAAIQTGVRTLREAYQQ